MSPAGILIDLSIYQAIYVFKNRDIFTTLQHDYFTRNKQSLIANKVHLSVSKFFYLLLIILKTVESLDHF